MSEPREPREPNETSSQFICQCQLENGYVLKNYFSFASLRARPTITFYNDRIETANRTADDKMYGKAILNGDEINLTWSREIPEEERCLSITLDSRLLLQSFSSIKKKDQARIAVHSTEESDYVLCVSCGAAGDGREGVRFVNATMTSPDKTLIDYPQPKQMSTITIPVKSFKQMTDSFTKSKSSMIILTYYDDTPPGLVMRTTEGIIEKFGEVPENLLAPGPNNFTVAKENIGALAKLSTLHSEGSIRFHYQQGKHARIMFRYGSFGEAEICITSS